MDIRSYFQPTRAKKDSSNSTPPPSNKNQRKRILIDSDSDEDVPKVTPKKKSINKAETKRKVIIDDSSDENETTPKSKAKIDNAKVSSANKRSRKSNSRSSLHSSPNAKSKPVQSKQINASTSKFFKEVSAADVFGGEPVKRDSTKLQEIKSKVQKSLKVVNNEIKVEDDADFEAALIQLDEVGDNWYVKKDNATKENQKEETKNEELENKPEKRKLTPQKVQKKEKESKTANEKKDDEVKRKTSHNDSATSDYFSCSNDSPTILSGSNLPSLSEEDFIETNKVSVKNQNTEKQNMNTSSILRSKKKDNKMITKEPVLKQLPVEKKTDSVDADYCSPWVEKYKPDSTKKIIGQQGDKSNVNKLKSWLTNWYKNNAGNKKPKFVPNGWNKDPTGACFKAALLSGPPGVGKTTTVTLLCKELGFETVEFNASDTRSKKQLQEGVSKMLTNTSLASHFTGESKSVTNKHVLVMDEVDGMAGNEDRGGVQELIQLIKLTKVPIICMCNDRAHPKMKSLLNYCFDLRFSRPRAEQIKGYMRSVCFKEKLELPGDMLNSIIASSNNDVRLILNHLSMVAASKNSKLAASEKHVKLGPWDAVRKVFNKQDHQNMSIHDKFDLFFYDYSIAPLFVQENYLSVKPLNVKPEEKCKRMKLFAETAHSISIGDGIEKEIRKNGAWSLLPTQAVFASYAPGEILGGYFSSQINFPSWLGKNSRQGKIDRLLQEIQVHTRLKVSASKQSINLEYAPFLRNYILEPLQKSGSEGAKASIDRLNDYELLKEDLDSINEICNWPNMPDPLSSLDSKVKAALTRLYNKNPPVRAYSLTAPIKSKVSDSIDELDEDNAAEDEETDDEKSDSMIIVKKKQTNQNSNAIPSTSSSKRKAATPKESNSKRGRKK